MKPGGEPGNSRDISTPAGGIGAGGNRGAIGAIGGNRGTGYLFTAILRVAPSGPSQPQWGWRAARVSAMTGFPRSPALGDLGNHLSSLLQRFCSCFSFCHSRRESAVLAPLFPRSLVPCFSGPWLLSFYSLLPTPSSLAFDIPPASPSAGRNPRASSTR